jgi:hypothetical protein
MATGIIGTVAVLEGADDGIVFPFSAPYEREVIIMTAIAIMNILVFISSNPQY